MKPAKTSYFGAALRSFVGHLEGTGKSEHTIRNYRLDLEGFERYLLDARPASLKGSDLRGLTPEHVDAFHDRLRAEGLRSNTRRRKILTVGKFLRYVAGRNRATKELGRKYAAPHKIERVPAVVDVDRLLAAIRALPVATKIEARNRALLWVLAETGCLVSEARKIRTECFSPDALVLPTRKIPISPELYRAVAELGAGGDGALFTGFNRHGPLPGAITARGIELLVKAYGPRLGFPALTPRAFRHSAAVAWFRAGRTRAEVRERLGLKTEYAFRAYAALLQQSG